MRLSRSWRTIITFTPPPDKSDLSLSPDALLCALKFPESCSQDFKSSGARGHIQGPSPCYTGSPEVQVCLAVRRRGDEKAPLHSACRVPGSPPFNQLQSGATTGNAGPRQGLGFDASLHSNTSCFLDGTRKLWPQWAHTATQTAPIKQEARQPQPKAIRNTIALQVTLKALNVQNHQIHQNLKYCF